MILKEIMPDDPDYYKSLDELIEDLGHAEPASRYGDVQIMVEDLTDALHYLKEFQRYQNTPSCSGHMALVDYLESQKNEPLTWDELKTMQGEPVWVEIIGRTIPLDSSWGIATGGSYHTWQGVESWRLVRPGAEYSLPVAQYGKTWQAYRKERK